MNIPSNQVKSKKEVGTLDGSKVFQIGTVGGLFLCVVAKSTPEVIGVGPHPGIARFLARKRCPDISFTALEKSEILDPKDFADLVPTYEDLTNKFRNA